MSGQYDYNDILKVKWLTQICNRLCPFWWGGGGGGGAGPLVEGAGEFGRGRSTFLKTLAWHAGKVKVKTLMIALSDNLFNCLSSGELVYKMTKVKMSCLQLICMMMKSIWSSATVLWLMWSGLDTETLNLAKFQEILVFWEGKGKAQYSHIKHKSVFTPNLCRQFKQFIGSCYLHH